MSQPLSKTASHAGRAVFRPRSEFPEYRVALAQLKGHQTKALTRMQQLAPQINLVLELRDSRTPLSSSNVLIDKIFKGKDKVIVYTKGDMSPLSSELLSRWHAPRNETFVELDCRRGKDIHKVLGLLKSKYGSMKPPPPLGLRLMVTGMPNVGKSTLVNGLRQHGLQVKHFKKVARTGDLAGVTRNTSEIIRICEKPEILLYDTPGVLLPQVNDIKTMLGLYLVGTVSGGGHMSATGNGVDPVIAADYLLYMLNLNEPSGKLYRRYLARPTNDVYELLEGVGKVTRDRRRSRVDGVMRANYTGCALHLVQEFRRGKLGKVCLDEEVLKGVTGEEYARLFEQEEARVGGLQTRIGVMETLYATNEREHATVEEARVAKLGKHQRKKQEQMRQSNQLFF